MFSTKHHDRAFPHLKMSLFFLWPPLFCWSGRREKILPDTERSPGEHLLLWLEDTHGNRSNVDLISNICHLFSPDDVISYFLLLSLYILWWCVFLFVPSQESSLIHCWKYDKQIIEKSSLSEFKEKLFFCYDPTVVMQHRVHIYNQRYIFFKSTIELLMLALCRPHMAMMETNFFGVIISKKVKRNVFLESTIHWRKRQAHNIFIILHPNFRELVLTCQVLRFLRH